MTLQDFRIDWRSKLAVGSINLVVWFVGYFTLNRHPFETYWTVPETALDALPFVPWTIIPYLSSWLFSAIGIFALPSGQYAWRFLGSVVVAYAISFATFASWPTRLDPSMRAEADPSAMSPWFAILFEWVHAADGPFTCFPSLHVTNCVLVLLAHWGTPRAPWMSVWASAIALSTMTTRQHVAVDVLSGIAVGALGVWVARRVAMRSTS